jgi:hypothetical protein
MAVHLTVAVDAELADMHGVQFAIVSVLLLEYLSSSSKDNRELAAGNKIQRSGS